MISSYIYISIYKLYWKLYFVEQILQTIKDKQKESILLTQKKLKKQGTLNAIFKILASETYWSFTYMSLKVAECALNGLDQDLHK